MASRQRTAERSSCATRLRKRGVLPADAAGARRGAEECAEADGGGLALAEIAESPRRGRREFRAEAAENAEERRASRVPNKEPVKGDPAGTAFFLCVLSDLHVRSSAISASDLLIASSPPRNRPSASVDPEPGSFRCLHFRICLGRHSGHQITPARLLFAVAVSDGTNGEVKITTNALIAPLVLALRYCCRRTAPDRTRSDIGRGPVPLAVASEVDGSCGNRLINAAAADQPHVWRA